MGKCAEFSNQRQTLWGAASESNQSLANETGASWSQRPAATKRGTSSRGTCVIKSTAVQAGHKSEKERSAAETKLSFSGQLYSGAASINPTRSNGLAECHVAPNASTHRPNSLRRGS